MEIKTKHDHEERKRRAVFLLEFTEALAVNRVRFGGGERSMVLLMLPVFVHRILISGVCVLIIELGYFGLSPLQENSTHTQAHSHPTMETGIAFTLLRLCIYLECHRGSEVAVMVAKRVPFSLSRERGCLLRNRGLCSPISSLNWLIWSTSILLAVYMHILKSCVEQVVQGCVWRWCSIPFQPPISSCCYRPGVWRLCAVEYCIYWTLFRPLHARDRSYIMYSIRIMWLGLQ